MLKQFLLFTVTAASFAVCAQNKLAIAVSVSNQGQIDRPLDDFYYPAQNDYFQLDESKINSLKYNLAFSFEIKPGQQLRLRTSYGNRNLKSNSGVNSYPSNVRIVNQQQFFEITPGYGFIHQIGRLRIGAGAELPFYLIDQFRQDVFMGYYNDPSTEYLEAFTSMKGGVIFGVNGFLNLHYDFGKHFSAFTELNYGVMHSELGGTIHYEEQGGASVSENKTQSSTFFSGMQAQLGIAFRL